MPKFNLLLVFSPLEYWLEGWVQIGEHTKANLFGGILISYKLGEPKGLQAEQKHKLCV